jgi:ketosteroid isomerase-like protein
MSSGAGGDSGQARRNVELTEAAFVAFAKQGPSTVTEVLDPEVEVHSEQTMANAGTFHGVPGYLRWSERWFEAWDEFEIVVEMIEPVGESHVVASCRQAARGRSSGVPVEMPACYMFEISEASVVRFHLYNTRDEAIAEARRGEAGEPTSFG